MSKYNGKSLSILSTLLFMTLLTNSIIAGTAVFDDNLLSPESYWNGADESGGFVSGTVAFNNNYNTTYGSWDGWAYSNKTNTTTPGYSNQYSAITGVGQGGSANYGVAYVSAWATEKPNLSLTDTSTGYTIPGAYITNTTYAYLSMRDGDAYSKQFGGVTGNDEDWFCLTIKGLDNLGQSTGTVDFYLADFRFADHGLDYIVNQWTWVNLSSLGDVVGLEFSLSSSDVGDNGINTPTYFAMDNLVPEPMTALLCVMGSLTWIRRMRR